MLSKSKGSKLYREVVVYGHGYYIDSKKVKDQDKDYMQYARIKRLNNKTVKVKPLGLEYGYV